MPLYDYMCTSCGEVRELLGRMNIDSKIEYCPGCDNIERFRKLFSPSTNFILKGKGWAKDNYSKPKKEKGK